MRKKILNVLKYVIFLSLGLVLLYLAFKGVDLKNLWQDLLKADYRWVVLALTVSLFSHLSRAVRWRILIETLGYRPSLKNTFMAVLIGYFANLAAPRLGEITRCGSLTKTDKIPFDGLIGTVIVERIIDVLTLGILTMVIFFAKIDFFGKFLIQNIFNPLSDKISTLFPSSGWAWLLFFIALSSLALFWVFRYRISHFVILQKIRKLMLGVIAGLKSVYTMKNFRAFIFHTISIWGMYFLMTWIMCFALPETSGLKPIDGLFLLVIGSLGMAAPVQGGIGAFHWIVSLGLTLYGIPKEKGLVYATLSHESQIFLLIIFGSLSLFIVLFQNRKKQNLTEKQWSKERRVEE